MKIESFQQLIDLVERLRGPNGCPHDRAQTLHSWSVHARGEVSELAYAIRDEDSDNLCEELGDSLWCLVHIGMLAVEKGLFTMEEALKGVTDKMRRRHPHVFGDAVANTPEEADALYHKTKEEERRGEDG